MGIECLVSRLSFAASQHPWDVNEYLVAATYSTATLKHSDEVLVSFKRLVNPRNFAHFYPRNNSELPIRSFYTDGNVEMVNEGNRNAKWQNKHSSMSCVLCIFR